MSLSGKKLTYTGEVALKAERLTFDQALPAIMKLMEEEEVNVPKKEKGGNLTRQIHYFNRILSGFAI